MKGGAIEINSLRYGDIPADQAFIIFEQNSTKDFYMLGTTGILFLLKLNEEISSPFVSLNPMGEEIKILIVKYVLFSSRQYFFKYRKQDNTYKRIGTVTDDETIKECDIQRLVYETSNGYISPICPFVVSFDSRPIDQCFFFQNVEEINDTDPKNTQASQSKRGQKHNISYFGVIAMELPNKCEPLYKKPEEIPIWDAISIFEILRLFFESSIIHGDLHGGNVLIVKDNSYFGDIYSYRAIIIDYGRSFKNEITKPATYNGKTMNFEKACKDHRNLNIMMNFIYNAGYVYDGKFKKYSSDQYEWIKNDSVLTSIFSILQDLYKNRQIQISEIMKTYRPFVTISDMGSNHQGMPIIDITCIQYIISQSSQQRELEAEQQRLFQVEQQRLAAEAEQQRLFQVEQQRLAAEAEQQRLFQVEQQRLAAEAASVDNAARHHIINYPQVSSINIDVLESLARQFHFSQFNLFQKLKELLLLSQNIITSDIINLIHTIRHLQVEYGQGKIIGGSAPALTTEYSLNQLTQQTKKGPNNNDNQIQAKIAEIKQIQATMADTFADWRNEVYKIYTNPNVEEKNAYYQEQTPFIILTHVMVCSGLFGPLTSGKYIDVKEEENKELYDKLNSIAAAFVTMNNGYLSMSNVKTQLMIEDAKNASVSVTVEKVVEGPTVEVSQYNPDKLFDESIVDQRRVGVEGFGGNKKYSRRKGRRHSKRQKKRCRRKSNKRFYSKKRYSKKRRK
jgi:hypothetical protein